VAQVSYYQIIKKHTNSY